MAPIPDDMPHYDGASPLDGGGNPASLGGGDAKFSLTGLEIGLIVGVVSLAVVSLVWLFFWRSRRNRPFRQPRTPSITTTHGHDAELIDTSGLRIPTPISKDDRASTVEKDEVASIDRPPRSQRRLMTNWSH
ncbi:hypothetical protein F5B22DRAFT_643807 [Xylaria bambusicola]|uniref:uncharacterized protein n=1 Tax=Xylaria bambusicola TaxID=326684 RepID=UPI002007499C|nr:uncharacterized protein F5B22DRAFT_643807 [Xylaria bambusicola]KAI0521632.1 hypothetical protein F5B22DRAFT_643807 [Xylaria bambusicola]